MRLLVSNVRIVQPKRVFAGSLLVEDGKFTGLFDTVQRLSVDEVIDGSECYALPGLIEVHGHMREPGLTHKEDYITGTAAAAAGGYTTFLDMPNTNPPTTTVERLQEKAVLAHGRCAIDYGFIFGGSVDNQGQLAAVSPKDVIGVKFFTAGHETTPTVVTDLGVLFESLKILASRGLLALVHAENQQLINALSTEAVSSGLSDGWSYSQSRGEPVVALQAWALVQMERFLKGRLYLLHVSTPSEIEAIKWGRQNGVNVFGEAAVYHLAYNTDDYSTLGNLVKVSPALREPWQQDFLWDSLLSDHESVPIVSSEHTPHTKAEKDGTIWQAASGMPGIQEALPTMITALATRYSHLTIDERMRRIGLWMSTHVAGRLGLSGKGQIAIGFDADFTLVQPERTWKVRTSDLLSKCGWSASEGRTLLGRPTHTFVRGRLVYHEGKVVEPGTGRKIRLS